jgi:hypothetical protein
VSIHFDVSGASQWRLKIDIPAQNLIASTGAATLNCSIGDGMHRNAQGWQKPRGLTACVLIYALFVHGMAFAMAGGARLSGDAAGGSDWAGFELCRHDNAAPALPGDPDGQAGDTHCVFCVAGPGFVLEPPPAVSTVFCPVEISIAPWPLVAWRLAAGDSRRQCTTARASGRGVKSGGRLAAKPPARIQ